MNLLEWSTWISKDLFWPWLGKSSGAGELEMLEILGGKESMPEKFVTAAEFYKKKSKFFSIFLYFWAFFHTWKDIRQSPKGLSPIQRNLVDIVAFLLTTKAV